MPGQLNAFQLGASTPLLSGTSHHTTASRSALACGVRCCLACGQDSTLTSRGVHRFGHRQSRTAEGQKSKNESRRRLQHHDNYQGNTLPGHIHSRSQSNISSDGQTSFSDQQPRASRRIRSFRACRQLTRALRRSVPRWGASSGQLFDCCDRHGELLSGSSTGSVTAGHPVRRSLVDYRPQPSLGRPDAEPGRSKCNEEIA